MSENYIKILQQLDRILRRKTLEYLEKGYSRRKIYRLIKQDIALFNPYSRLSEQFAKDALSNFTEILASAKQEYDFVEQKTLAKIDEEASKIISAADKQFIRVANNINEKAVLKIRQGLYRELTAAEIAESLKTVTKLSTNHATAVTDTFITGYDRMANFELAAGSGADKFRYGGASPEREFCTKHYDKIYTLEQIDELNNGQGLSVRYYCGGYRCRHNWEPVL